MSIISISGRLNSGKDSVAALIQYLIWKDKVNKGEIPLTNLSFEDFLQLTIGRIISGWEVKKFADKLKDITCMLLGCTKEQLEDRDFKEKELGEEWKRYILHYQFQDKYGRFRFEEMFSSEKDALQFKDNLEQCDAYGIVEEKLTPRLFMQLLGTECGRKILHPNIWVNSLMTEYKESLPHTKDLFDVPEVEAPDAKETTWIKDQYPNWIISDTRFPNELKAIKDRGGITIRVNRPDFVENALTGEKFPVKVHRNEHPSETALDNAEFDYVIENSGSLKDLEEKVLEILRKEKLL